MLFESLDFTPKAGKVETSDPKKERGKRAGGEDTVFVGGFPEKKGVSHYAGRELEVGEDSSVSALQIVTTNVYGSQAKGSCGEKRTCIRVALSWLRGRQNRKIANRLFASRRTIRGERCVRGGCSKKEKRSIGPETRGGKKLGKKIILPLHKTNRHFHGDLAE